MGSLLPQYADLIDRAVTRKTSTKEMISTLVASLDRRLVAIEDSERSFESVKQELIGLGLANLTQILQPVADDLLITLAEAEARLAGIEGGVLFAINVNTSPITGISGTNVQQMLVSVRDALEGKIDESGGSMTGPLALFGSPTSADHAATKQYVDSLVTGLAVKTAVKAASPDGVNVNVASAPASLDGVAGVVNDRWLLRQETLPAQNGVWIFQGTGAALVRAGDMDTWGEVLNAVIAVEGGGTAVANTVWVSDAVAGGTLGTTALGFNKFGSFQGLNQNLTALANLTLAPDKLAYATGLGAVALTSFPALGRTLVGQTLPADMRAVLELGTAATAAVADFAAVVHSHAMSDITGLAAALGAKADLSGNVGALNALSIVADRIFYGNGVGTMAMTPFTGLGRTVVGVANQAALQAAVGMGAVGSLAQITESDLVLADNLLNNVSTARHGFMPKLPNDASKFFNGAGGFTSASGAFNQLAVGTIGAQTNIDLDLTAFVAGNYKKIYIHLIGVVPAQDNRNLQMRTSANSGASFESATNSYLNSGGGNMSTIQLAKNVGNGPERPIEATIELTAIQRTTVDHHISWKTATWDAVNDDVNTSADIAIRNITGSFNAVRFYMSTGDFAGGNYAIYGLN